MNPSLRMPIFIFLLIAIGIIAYFNLTYHLTELRWLWENNQGEQVNEGFILLKEFRLPRVFISIIAGGGLAITGMLMQTLFQNPLAGPYVLGINSGSNLFIGISLLTGIPFLMSEYGMVLTAFIGALLFGLLILLFSTFIKKSISLLLIGLMISSFTSAILSILESSSSANNLKSFVIWGMGSLQKVEFAQIGFITITFLILTLFSLTLMKALNALVLGETSASALGISVKRERQKIIVISSLFIGLITAYCGPIAFVGLTVPNLARILFKTQNHQVLFFANLLIGSFFLLLCDSIILLLEPYTAIPINGITSLIGAPMVILFILKNGRI